MSLVSMGLLIFDLMLTLAADTPVPRRDDLFPPREALEFAAEPHRLCVAETGVSEAAITRFSDADIFEDDEKLKCYMSCVFQKTNVTDAGGELHLGKLLDMVPKDFEDIALKMGGKCTKPKGKNVCERAFWFHKCWKMADPVHYFLL
ncbi:general odorant-binding protein 83a-like [Topomyia yanbarensis]|uniref:general odorant-binding protein 83a-like n=1 Tax=Topomyia yanbarensis TaxID=2498891 RepID=UPI00273C76C6|nr:general odorant-binding protein 83a-like [Topomyia yanbarensis]